MNSDTPLVILTVPELSDEAAARLLDFLYELPCVLENHYAAQLRRHYRTTDERQLAFWDNSRPYAVTASFTTASSTDHAAVLPSNTVKPGPSNSANTLTTVEIPYKSISPLANANVLKYHVVQTTHPCILQHFAS